MIIATSASAFEIGVVGSTDVAGKDTTAAGVTVSQKFGDGYGVGLTLDRSLNKGNDTNRIKLIGQRDVLTLGSLSFNAQGGAAYIRNAAGNDGYALVYGVGSEFKLTNSVTAVASLNRQIGQAKIESTNTNTASIGLNYSF